MNKNLLEMRAAEMARLARCALDTPEETLLWQEAEGWRDFLHAHWRCGEVDAIFDDDLIIHADLADHIESMIYLHEMQQGDRGMIRYLRKHWEQGQVVLDVGANIGVISLLAAKRVGPQGRVIAIEPITRNVHRLRRNLARNPQLQVEVFLYAISHLTGHIALYPVTGNNHGMYSAYPQGSEQPIEVMPCMRLDDFCAHHGITRLDWIKVDIEGSEANLLAGARQVLSGLRPRIAMEISREHLRRAGSSPDALLNAMVDLDYQPYGFSDDGAPTPLNPDLDHQNILFLPQ